MNQREILLQQLRQQINAEVHLAKEEEQFQNEVLRPCIKTQSDVLICKKTMPLPNNATE